MIDELFIYDRDKGLFKEILKQSTVIQGRYHVSPNYGHDLNTNNLDAFIKDAVYGLTDVKQKYPICVCMPPKSSLVKINNRRWEQFYFTLFFLCTTYYTGQNQVKSLDKSTNTSGHHVWYDWKDMKEVSLNFIEILKSSLGKQVEYNSIPTKLSSLISFDNSRVDVNRLSRFNNDRLSGVAINISMALYSDSCSLNDYEAGAVDNIELPSLSIHPIHKH